MSLSTFQPFGISKPVYDLSIRATEAVQSAFDDIERIREINQLRVIGAMHEARLSESFLGGSTGYGYDDPGRDQIEQAYALAFGGQSALVRIQISSGTQALAMCLYGLLRPGDALLSVTGTPYDSLMSTIGVAGKTQGTGSLQDFGVVYREIDLAESGQPDLDAIRSAVDSQTKVVYVQKSRGYTLRRSLLAEDIERICETIKAVNSETVILVDNCYGEFVEPTEPCMAGADLCAGSLIKNPGGGLCPSGGYVVGRKDLVEQVAERLTAPGLGSHVGPTLGFNRQIAQGFYLAPHVVAECLKGAVFASALFSLAGFKTYPTPDARRGDIVQTIELGSPEKLVAFCQAIQAASPVDSHVQPRPWDMPGYDSPVIMAAGTFVQGASIELSADGPLRAPYPAYLQGGLCYENVKLAAMMAVERTGGSSA